MTPKSAKNELESRVKQICGSAADLIPAQGIRLMLDFYRDVRAEQCMDLGKGGDMLLFQWGTHDWGQGPSFQLDITRQFIMVCGDDEDDDDAISQLSMCFHFPPSAQFNGLGGGNRWCDTPDDLESFEAFIIGSAAYRAVHDSCAAKVVVHFQDGGV
jgi:hypothetical protein